MTTTYDDLIAQEDDFASGWEQDFTPPPADGQSAEAERLKATKEVEFSNGWADLEEEEEDEEETGNSTAPNQTQLGKIETKTLDPLPPVATTAPVSVPGKTTVQASAVTVPSASSTKPVEPLPQPKNFGSAFAQARKAGLSVFEWNGKQYTTQTKEEAAAGRKAPAKTSTPTTAPKAATPAAAAPASRPAAMAATAPTRTASPPPAAPASAPVKAQSAPTKLTYRQELQKSYDDWQAAKSSNTTWYGGKAQGSPGRIEAETQAEQRYLDLLRNPR